MGYVQRVQDIELTDVDHDKVTEEMVEANIIRCPDALVAERMIARVDEIRWAIHCIVLCVDLIIGFRQQ